MIIVIPAALAVLTASGYLLLAAWMRLHGPAVARQYRAAFRRERAARAAESVPEEVSR